ncbi:DUF262 domain-containing protein [Hymenobacter rubripertinctus]|uniref:DUF262 domain-containing protein n=1 Tax=Hymenobacter rubripertinctus TaxID=2029981 RepID=A0A418QQT3_9BACT|nr:DUF262 domain-containing protein [Hymenobacter rubripertinctus]RIY07607.1 DUF262 domain-containing protein [Hymenobacter rubripertinctus]
MKMISGRRALDKVYKRRDRYDIPDWQRDEVWDIKKKQKLIDSILKGWRLPKFYLLKTAEDEYEVVDGQQRLSSIIEFFNNELALSEESAKKFGDSYYKDLPPRISDNFDDFEIDFDEIQGAEDEELKEFFQRLQEGLPLTSSEKLNSVHSKLRNFCKEISNTSFFKNKVFISDNRFSYFDIATKVVTLEIEGITSGIRYEDIFKVFKANVEFSVQSAVGKRITDTFNYLDKVFPERSPLLKNRTVIQSYATFIAGFISTGKAKGQEPRIKAFFENFTTGLVKQIELGKGGNDMDYLKFQRSISANVKSGASTRQDVLMRKILQSDPILASLFGPTKITQSGIDTNIRALSDSISNRIAISNAAFSSLHGEDLFKATNKTVQALKILGEPIKNLTDYKLLIDNLYFLFKESIGQRLGEKVPQSFIDVNALRTEIEHDVDHGDKSRIRSKRKKIGETFKKYSGTTSPQTLAPEMFPVFQLQLLSKLEEDIQLLAIS